LFYNEYLGFQLLKEIVNFGIFFAEARLVKGLIAFLDLNNHALNYILALLTVQIDPIAQKVGAKDFKLVLLCDP